MSREMDDYGIPGEEHVSDAEIWETQQRYAGNPARMRAALRNMGYDGPQLYPERQAGSATPALDAMRRSLERDGGGQDVHEGPEF